MPDGDLGKGREMGGKDKVEHLGCPKLQKGSNQNSWIVCSPMPSDGEFREGNQVLQPGGPGSRKGLGGCRESLVARGHFDILKWHLSHLSQV